MIFFNCVIPRPFLGFTAITGTPSSLSSSAILIFIPFFFAMSVIVNAITTGTFRSMICVQKSKLRFKLLASATATITLALISLS